MHDVIVVGSGNAALCAAIAARESGADVLVIEKAKEDLAGGNSKYTAGAMRFVYNNNEELHPLLNNPDDPRLPNTEFGSYSAEKFGADLLGFNDGRPLSKEQDALINQSYNTMLWLSGHGITFEPIYERQSFEKDGKHIFWGGLTLASDGEGVGLVEAELDTFLEMGGSIRYDCAMKGLVSDDGAVTGVEVESSDGSAEVLPAKAVILGCGGFESSSELRKKYIGENWDKAKVRGTPHNTGDGLELAFELGAKPNGFYQGCHATPMDLHMKDYGNLDIPHLDRKNYRKICYFLGIMVNGNGDRFVDEGKDFRNYTYAQFGAAVLEQPGHFAWQIFDSKVDDLLYGEYRFHDAHFVEADTLDGLIDKLDGVDDKDAVRKTIADYNEAVDLNVDFDPTIKDGKGTNGLPLPKSNWAQKIDQGPFKAFPVTGGITFTYGGVEVDEVGAVLKEDGRAIPGLFACGEMVGGVFFNGYPWRIGPDIRGGVWKTGRRGGGSKCCLILPVFRTRIEVEEHTMAQQNIPCILMRGGTSKGPYFNAADLPEDRDALARILINAVGAGHSLNIDGIGGGNAVTTKVAMLSPSDHEWADVDYFFAQVAVEKELVDFSPTCGNILSGVGPAALEMGLLPARTGETSVKIRSVNTGALIEAIVQTPDSVVLYDGDASINGVPGTAAPVILNFMNVVGSKTGALFPTGKAKQLVDGIEVTCIDVAMPMVIARATDFSISGYESREELDENKTLFEKIEPIRRKAGELMGFGDVTNSVVPKFGLLAAPQNGGSIAARYFMPWTTHPSFAVTGSVCVGSCLLAPGTVADGLAQVPSEVPAPVKIEHPMGAIDVVLDYSINDGKFDLKSAGLLRTARKLFSGHIHVPTD